MKANYQLYSTAGQVTALVTNENPNAQLSCEIMKNDTSIEQVGFISYNTTPRLQMMGGELCINASLAAGVAFCKKLKQNSVKFYTSGITDLVSVKKINGKYSLKLPSAIIIENDSDYVEFSGIAFFLEEGFRSINKITRDEKVILQGFGLAKGAAGYIFYEGNTIQPVVYVNETGTTVWENACGSGSLAYSLISGIKNIQQPSGEIISIEKINDTLTISASVKEIR